MKDDLHPCFHINSFSENLHLCPVIRIKLVREVTEGGQAQVITGLAGHGYMHSSTCTNYNTSITQCLFGAEPECKLMQFAKLEDAYIWNVTVVP